MPVDTQAIHDRVSFDIVLKNFKGNYTSFETISFRGTKLGQHMDWVAEVCSALQLNTTCTDLDLSDAYLTDEAIQRLAVTLSAGSIAPQLRLLDLRNNAFSLAGETMMQGLCKLRTALKVRLDDGPDASEGDGFVHNKMLVEELTAWPGESLGVGKDLRCPPEIVGSDEVVILKKGFQGSNGTKYTCEHAEFSLMHGTGNLVLKRLEPEAKMRLSSICSSKPTGGGVLV
mmetsp:Transcript_46704/g.77288  ORF Transcript_46704/g.77288 Transcript_46704/m.77288 type:complete len:229 (-) Transcript_46704:53-739(-)